MRFGLCPRQGLRPVIGTNRPFVFLRYQLNFNDSIQQLIAEKKREFETQIPNVMARRREMEKLKDAARDLIEQQKKLQSRVKEFSDQHTLRIVQKQQNAVEERSADSTNQYMIIQKQIGEQVKLVLDSFHRKREQMNSRWADFKVRKLKEFYTWLGWVSVTTNDVTGYSSINQMKLNIEKLEIQVKESRDKVKEMKKVFDNAISIRTQSQKQINELLTRKHLWSPDDLGNFTKLYTEDHSNETAVQTAKHDLESAEAERDSCQTQLSTEILKRYHEEQIWSDKIRRVSTWGTLGLMGLNIVLFLLVQTVFEPLKRERLVSRFETKVRDIIGTGEKMDEKEVEKEVEKELEQEVEKEVAVKIENKVENAVFKYQYSIVFAIWNLLRSAFTFDRSVISEKFELLKASADAWRSNLLLLKKSDYGTVFETRKLDIVHVAESCLVLGVGIGCCIGLVF